MKKKKGKENKNNVVCWSPHVKFKNIDKRDWKKKSCGMIDCHLSIFFLKNNKYEFFQLSC